MYRTILLLAALLLVGCSAPPTTADPAPAPTPDLRGAVLSMERTVCFGTCPAYTVTLDGDGTVEWLGHNFVEVEGEARSSADPAEVQALIQSFLDAGFMQMKDEYSEVCDAGGECHTVTDLPSTIFVLNVDGQEKRVVNYYGGPEVLDTLAERVDALANTAAWIGDRAP